MEEVDYPTSPNPSPQTALNIAWNGLSQGPWFQQVTLKESREVQRDNGFLLTAYLCEMICFGLIQFVPSIGLSVVSAFAIFGILVTYAIYKDAAKINQRAGARVIDATLLSLLTLVLSYVIVPFYVLVPRRKALSREGV
ncbi:MAG: hypothetical protein OK456_00740 [Thaumarchaeota archaeon]|nr:hypothetical protein [Nitrososphaerota archaeon]